MTSLPKGTQITCPNGHPVVTVARDLQLHSEQDASKDWTDWQQPEPARGTVDPKCTICGEPWMVNHHLIGTRVHSAEGWWPSVDSLRRMN